MTMRSIRRASKLASNASRYITRRNIMLGAL